MAQTSNTLFFKLALLLSLLVLTISVAHSRNFGLGKQDAGQSCNSVYGVESGDTCTTVANEFGLSFQDFLNINPNVNCDAIFVGQWLCLVGSS